MHATPRTAKCASEHEQRVAQRRPAASPPRQRRDPPQHTGPHSGSKAQTPTRPGAVAAPHAETEAGTKTGTHTGAVSRTHAGKSVSRSQGRVPAQLHSRPIAAIPRPGRAFIGRIALQTYEVIEGTRSLAQLGNLITFELSLILAEQRAARQEQQQVYRDTRYATPHCGSVHSCQINAGTVEAAVVLHTTRRSHAVAIRLEWGHSRWRASYIAVL